MQRSWDQARPGLLEEQQEAYVASERKECGGVENRESLGRAGHRGPVGCMKDFLPSKKEVGDKRRDTGLDSGEPRRPLAVVGRTDWGGRGPERAQGPGRRRLDWSRTVMMGLDPGRRRQRGEG